MKKVLIISLAVVVVGAAGFGVYKMYVKNVMHAVITGTVTLGPICPVERIPPDPRCAPKGYETDIKALDGDSIIGTTHTEADGSFTLIVPYGTYKIQAGGGAVYPRCSPIMVIAQSPVLNGYKISCDTGIR